MKYYYTLAILLNSLFLSSCIQEKSSADNWNYIDCSLLPSDNMNLSIRIDRLGDAIILYDKWLQSSNIYKYNLSPAEINDISTLLDDIGDFTYQSKDSYMNDVSSYHIIAVKGIDKINVFSYNDDCARTEKLYNYIYKLIKRSIKEDYLLFESRTEEFIIAPPIPMSAP